MNYKKEIIFGTTLFFVIGLIAYLYCVTKFFKTAQPSPSVPITTETSRIDFGKNLPPDFPMNIPIEEGVMVDQSYSLNYAGQNQLTIVFPTSKTVTQNYVLYVDFLEKDGWAIANKYESENVSSLYGTKGINEINVTITEKQVSVSVLK